MTSLFFSKDRKLSFVVWRLTTSAVVWTLLVAATGGCRCGTVDQQNRWTGGLDGAAGTRSGDGAASPLDGVLSPSSPSSVVDDRAARLDAIKADILGKLGVDSESDLPPAQNGEITVAPLSNASLAERQRVIDLYRQSVEQLKGKTHRVDDGYQPKAKQFFSFRSAPYNDTMSIRIRSSVSRRHFYIRFLVDLPSSSTSLRPETEADDDAPGGGGEFVVKSASLKLFRRTRRRHTEDDDPAADGRLRINVYQVLADADSSAATGSRRRRRIRKRLIDTRLIRRTQRRRRRRRDFEEFDVAKTVRDWLADPPSNLGLLVTAEIERRNTSSSSSPAPATSTRTAGVRVADIFKLSSRRAVAAAAAVVVSSSNYTASSSSSSSFSPSRTVSSSPADDDVGPTLNVLGRLRRTSGSRRGSSDDRRGRRRRPPGRTRRSAADGDCRPGDGETRCCRRPLWVSFREIGWDRWIMAPDGYQAFYCDGSCPPQHRVANRHAGVQALVNGARPDAAPSPCCAPSRMSSLPIAHLNADGRPVVSVFENMIVNECMCT